MPEVFFHGPVAQLDRATVSGTVCRGFESLLVRFFMFISDCQSRVPEIGTLFLFVNVFYCCAFSGKDSIIRGQKRIN